MEEDAQKCFLGQQGPIGNVHIATTYLSLLPINEGDIPNLNWAKYAFEGMLAVVRTYKTGRAKGLKTKCIGGCIWILELFYLEHLAVGIIPQPLVERQPPRVSQWSASLISRVVKLVQRWRREFTTQSGGLLHWMARGQEESSLRNDLNSLKMEFERLETHVLSALNDIRRDVACMGHGQPAPNQDAAMNDVKEELASLKKKMDEMQGKLDAYKARDENATNPDVGAAMDHRENETRDVSQEDGDVPADHGPTAGPDPDIGVTQELHAVCDTTRQPGAKKGTNKTKDNELIRLVLSPSNDVPRNYLLKVVEGQRTCVTY
ncbi:hypothetical protein J5N97_020509 [Dioscorea zingiberensis]|uniref:Uncharacterized protein n=1 Tax=Dioscorea zingiberensis TaxID=325984 RepID=A0A9D5CI52_9LILI|nr:hypothetical protein J5N97_020509 [Dioscorea zingiberensis]